MLGTYVMGCPLSFEVHGLQSQSVLKRKVIVRVTLSKCYMTILHKVSAGRPEIRKKGKIQSAVTHTEVK